MAKKYFIRNGSVTTNGESRSITIVGCLDKTRYKNEDGETRKKRILTYAYSIRHPEDADDPRRGVELAVKRLKTDPMGELETKFTTCLNVDQILMVLDAELDYIKKNLDKFIDRI